MSEYIPIDEIPLHGNATIYPYAEWLKTMPCMLNKS